MRAIRTLELYIITTGSDSFVVDNDAVDDVVDADDALTEEATLMAAPCIALFLSFLHSDLWTFQCAF